MRWCLICPFPDPFPLTAMGYPVILLLTPLSLIFFEPGMLMRLKGLE